MPPTLPRGGPGADVKGPLSEWVVKERVRQGIKARFLNFLLTARNKAYRCAAIYPSIHLWDKEFRCRELPSLRIIGRRLSPQVPSSPQWYLERIFCIFGPRATSPPPFPGGQCFGD